jgi:hypothetical protein
MKRAASRRPVAGAVLLGCLLLPGLTVRAQAQPMAAGATSAATRTETESTADAAGDGVTEGGAAQGISVSRRANYCAALAASPWPQTASARRVSLHRFEALRSQCIDHAGYLAALGALWLEEGEPAQALLWLERSLLLDPDQLGAQADHALALAALGEPAAREALVEQWLSRDDVPTALRTRLALGPMPANGKSSANLRPANTVDGWAFYREASLLAGYETNLDHSPRLSEITLTFPEGSIELPLAEPLQPRKGSAMLADLSWQLAHSPRTGMVVQTGLQGSARHAPSEAETDFHHLQWAGNLSQQWGAWRGQLQSSASWVGGTLSEAYRAMRLGVALDREAVGCSHRASLEGETRTHDETHIADGRTMSAQWGSQCPLGGGGSWVSGLALRYSVDKPVDPTRPGGKQQQVSLGFRVVGPLGAGFRLDANVRATRVRDAEGYSPLLEGGAVRRLNQTQLSLELAKPMGFTWLAGAEFTLQMQAVRQTSNLAIFRHEGVSTYGGLRWRW